MKITKEVTVTLNVKELEILIKEFVEKKGIKVNSIHFRVGAHEVEGDFRSEFPPSYELDEVICKGTEK